ILLFLVVFNSNTLKAAYTDIYSGTASAYNKERNERDVLLRNFKGDSCMIDSIKDIPVSLYFKELPQSLNTINITSLDESTYERRKEVVKIFTGSFYEYYHKNYIGIKGRK
ncbi:MAG TPA: hypothetical protein VN922_03190, partial [Bacteroidia bacterium]|nr:hypothetical protein [Bacteroidia bacterium]